MALFSIWEDDGGNGGSTLHRGGDTPRGLNGTVFDPTAVKVKEFRAASWNEASQVFNDHYGLGYYEPQDWEEIGPDEA
jgi:hypothetical protein